MFKPEDPEIIAAFEEYDKSFMPQMNMISNQWDALRLIHQCTLIAINKVEEMRWRKAEEAPVGEFLMTKREGEKGINFCMTVGGGEWVEYGTGRTTVTHHSFLPPTHYYRMVSGVK